MKIALLMLAILAIFGALWLQIGLYALIVTPVIALFVLMAATPVFVKTLGYDL